MDEQLNTRTIMTGWVFSVAFLAAYLFHRCPQQILGDIKGDYVPLLVAILSAPFVGWSISALVLFLMWKPWSKRGNYGPYQGKSRTRIKEWIKSKLPEHLQAEAELRLHGDELLGYVLNFENPSGLIEWGRRRHTARFLGNNWPVATFLGLAAGTLYGLRHGWRFDWPELVLLVFVLITAFAVAYNGKKAKDEVERIELLWIEDFICRQKRQSVRSARHSKDSNALVLCQPEALRRWVKNLQPPARDTFLSKMRRWLRQ